MGSILKPLQLTLAIVKPHIVSHPIALQDIRNLILTSQFKIVQSDKRTLSQTDAENFYVEHREKFFYNRLVTFMRSGPIELYILAHENAVQEWRNLMGATKVYKTQYIDPASIRGTYGLSDTRNATHGSDSVNTARKEIGIFFPHFNIERWFKNEEPRFRRGQVFLDKDNFIHIANDEVISKAQQV